MTEDEKKKTANLEDVQAFGRIIHNKGIGSEGTCSTAAATAAKTVTVGATFKPVAGATLIVTFQNAISVANATLAVTYGASGSQQTLAAKPIYYRGSALAANLVEAGATLVLRYDGTNYNIIGSLQIDPFPSQSGNNGKFLKTNGSAVSWDNIPSDDTKTDKLPMTGTGAATENNFMAIDANGNIKDSGKNANSFLTQHQSIKTINGASIVGTGNVNLQTPLTFDTTPTANSNNPVTSGGVKNYVDDAIIDLPIPFESESVKTVIVELFGGAMGGQNHDIPGIRGEITYRQAASVYNLTSLFYADGRSASGSFNELKYFNKNANTTLMCQNAPFDSIYFPDGMTTMQGQSLASVTGYVDLPSSITTIGSYNFWYSKKSVVRLWATTPPTIDYSRNNNVEKILVPQSALAAYRADAQWGRFGDKLEGF